VSKSTVLKDISERLPQLNRAMYLAVKDVVERNKAERPAGREGDAQEI
jgi:putative DeoR family transcriptional regulator (stage III sporulation protein D)